MTKEIPTDRPTSVTKVTSTKKDNEVPLMSFTAVTSHQAMAEAFVTELARAASEIIPDRVMTAEDIVKVCQVALEDKPDRSITMVGGRHLRARISEQVSRANRYKEPFSLIILNLTNISEREDYDSIVDTLRERMRQTDLMFLFKHRIVLLLPHTEKAACRQLVDRITTLIKSCLVNVPQISSTTLTFPHRELTKTADLLDWTENQLRS
jgi:hypothetical protein